MKLGLALLAVLGAVGCRVKDPPPITEAWADLFERDGLGENWLDTSDGRGFRVVDGTLSARGAHNQPLWLRRALPRDVRVEFTAWSNSADGDLKVELFGDGRSYDPDRGAYQSTGYVFIFGGWGNSKSIIARQDEHGDDVVSRTTPKVVRGQKYAWSIERVGKRLTWRLDGAAEPFLQYDDDRPLTGDDHAYFAINNWESDTYFDDLRITPL
ncbi:MAG: hypothetical protein R2939_16780 [Kofleriaceae bacterium]